MQPTAFLYIHGVQPNLKTAAIRGYSKKFHQSIFNALRRLGKKTDAIRRFEVNWAPVTFGLKRRLAALQFDKFPARSGITPLRNALRDFIYPAVLDILYYVQNKGVEGSAEPMPIMDELHEEVLKICRRGFKKAIIFAHSLGSVAAYDYVFRFEKRYPCPAGLQLSALVTFGSPIPLFAAGMGYPVSTKIKRPPYIKKWINLWDHDDPIAGRCEPHFPKSFAKGFLEDIPVNTAWIHPIRAHERYWDHPGVTRRIAESLIDAGR